MPRGSVSPRMLWPDAALSRSLARCSRDAQLLFDRLVSLADDQGRQRDGADVVLGSAFPLLRDVEEADVERWLGELAYVRLIIRYEADEETLVQLRGWWEWQRLDWARASRYPAPEGWTDHVGKRPNPSGEPPSPEKSGPVRTSPKKENQNQNKNQNIGPGQSPDRGGPTKSFGELVGDIPALRALKEA